MKKSINLSLFALLIMLIAVSCKNEKKKDVKKTEATAVTQSKDKETVKKKTPKTDPFKIVAQAPEGTTAKSVVDNYFKVIGGIDKAKKVKTILQISHAVDNPDDTFELTTKYMLPNKMYEQTAIRGKVFSKNAFNGKMGYDEYNGERKTYTAEQNEQYDASKRIIFPDFDYAKGTLKGIAEVGGEKCYMIDYKNEKVYYSVATGLRVLATEIGKDEEGKDEVVVNLYTSNYKEADGLKFPFSIKESRPDMRSVRLNIQEIRVNKDVTNKDFE